jgi:hypothetical protein
MEEDNKGKKVENKKFYKKKKGEAHIDKEWDSDASSSDSDDDLTIIALNKSSLFLKGQPHLLNDEE